jgi:hypothetical protein
MVTLKKIMIIVLLINLLILNSCTLFSDNLKVEVQKGFVGWCYVIPVSDRGARASSVVNGKYQVDANGVVLIPASVFDVRKDHVVKVYETEVDISNDMRYAGSVHLANSTDSVKYDYIHFYLPPVQERAISNATQYWRDKMYEYDRIESKNFDSLLKARKIVF